MSFIPSAIDFLKRGTRTANHFGFQDLDYLRKHRVRQVPEQKVTHSATATDRRVDDLSGMLTSGICAYIDHQFYTTGDPALFYTTHTVPRTGETAISLQVLGVEKSIAESLLIQTIRALLEDLGFNDHIIRVNSLGDQESSTRYIRELTNFFRKRIEDLPVPARELMKDHVFSTLMYLIEKDHELAQKSPNPLEYLSDQSRKHFREVIEFLDMSQAPYEIDSKLLGNHQCYSDAIFSVELTGESHDPETVQPLYIRGGRYNTFVSRVSKSGIPAAGAVLVLRGKKSPAQVPKMRRGPKASVFVVQLGFGPKIRSLLLVHELQRAGVSIIQDIANDSLSSQLEKAEAYGARYAVIIGQKEFIDGNVILRNLEARSQEHVPIAGLPSHLKRLTR